MSEPLVDEVKKIARREAERIVRILLPKTVDDKLSDINKRLLLTEKMIHSASASNDPESTKKLAGTEMVTFRIQHGLSQRELAQLLGSHYTSICRWEKGRFHPGTSTVQLFEELRHMTHDEITAKLKTLSAATDQRCHAQEIIYVGPDSGEGTRLKR